MPNVELDDFFESPSKPLFDRLTKDQLCQVAAHYQFDINLPKGFNKQELKEIIKSKLVDLLIISIGTVDSSGPSTATSTPSAGEKMVSLGNSAEVLKLQLEYKRLESGAREGSSVSA